MSDYFTRDKIKLHKPKGRIRKKIPEGTMVRGVLHYGITEKGCYVCFDTDKGSMNVEVNYDLI